MICSTSNIPEIDGEAAPNFEPIRRCKKAIMPNRSGGKLNGQRSRRDARHRGSRGQQHPGAHQRRNRMILWEPQ